MYSYIHLNPAKLKNKNWKENKLENFLTLKDFLFKYKYSSLIDYLNDNYSIVDPSYFPDYKVLYDSKEEYLKAMVDDWISGEE